MSFSATAGVAASNFALAWRVGFSISEPAEFPGRNFPKHPAGTAEVSELAAPMLCDFALPTHLGSFSPLAGRIWARRA